MARSLTLSYSTEADVLVIRKCPAYIGQETEDVGDLMIARRNPTTGEIEQLEILFFMDRLRERGDVKLPLDDLEQTVLALQAA